MFLLFLFVSNFDNAANELELKSYTVEKAVKELITKFLSCFEEPELQDKLYNWLDPNKVLKVSGSITKLPTQAAGIQMFTLSSFPTFLISLSSFQGGGPQCST